MKTFSPEAKKLTPLQKTLFALEDARSELAKNRRKKMEPIAIIGMGCRFPGGADTPEKFWQLLNSGKDAIKKVHPDRWDVDAFSDSRFSLSEKRDMQWGGFLGHVDQFDARFFRISRREAESMDPQQRLLLEVSWEAIENAGIPHRDLSGSQTGVFVGITNNDYLKLQLIEAGIKKLDGFVGTGNSFSIAAARISFALGLHGPSVAIDTACSSSLVAIQHACTALRNDECDLVLAGGVNMLLSPLTTAALSKMQVLSPDGRCKTFDASADGFVRGEGCGVIVLKRLSDATACGDNILAIIRSESVNQDGHSGGLTVPNGLIQQKLIENAVKKAGIQPEMVQYVEAHGTGTKLGDPVEMEALLAALCKNRSKDNPLTIGSVKTNIGHLESASGIAGVIKTILSIQHQSIPSHLHFNTLNPHIANDEVRICIPKSQIDWPCEPDKPRIAGVSSFGFGGTNSHVILEEAPIVEQKSNNFNRPDHLFVFSAKNQQALKMFAEKYSEFFKINDEIPLAAVCKTALSFRDHFSHRIALLGKTHLDMNRLLLDFINGDKSVSLIQGHIQNPPRYSVKFIFPNQNFRSLDNVKSLYDTNPVFRTVLNKCNSYCNNKLHLNLLSDLFDTEKKANNDQLSSHLSLFATEYAMAALWRSCGVEPTELIGYGVGQYTAAAVAGVVRLEDALRMVVAQCHWTDGVIDRLALDATLQGIHFSPPNINMKSGLTGSPMENHIIVSPKYWVRQIKDADDSSIDIEIPEKTDEVFVLTGPVKNVPKTHNTLLLNSCVGGKAGWDNILYGIGQLYIRGYDFDFEQFDSCYHHRKIQLPTYPFQRQKYWIKKASNKDTIRRPKSAISNHHLSSLLGRRLNSALDIVQFESVLDISVMSFLNDHRIFDIAILSGPTHVEMMLESAVEVYDQKTIVINNVTLLQAITLEQDERKLVQTCLEPGESNNYFCRISSYSNEFKNWTIHSKGEIHIEQRDKNSQVVADTVQMIKERCKGESSTYEYYQDFEKLGFFLGSSYRWIEEIWTGDKEALCLMRSDDVELSQTSGYQFHPGLIDSTFQLILACLPAERSPIFEKNVYIPIFLEKFVFHHRPQGPIYCHASLILDNDSQGEIISGNLRLFNTDGNVIAELLGVRLKRTTKDMLIQKPHKYNEYKEYKASSVEIRDKILNASPEEQHRILNDYISEQISKILEQPISDNDMRETIINLGMNSLLVMQLKDRVENELQVELPVEAFLEGPSGEILAYRLLQQLTGISSELAIATEQANSDIISQISMQNTGMSLSDLNSEAFLASEITLAKDTATEFISSPTSIFVTGTTGFLGAFILDELLRQTDATVYCLVRASDVREGKKRIRDNLQSYLLSWDEESDKRVIPILGDLTQPLLGISSNAFRDLASRIDTIYHCGALVNFNYPYSTIKSTNVKGTHEIIRFAAMERVKHVHYVSTYSILFGFADRQIVEEDIELDSIKGLYIGYAQSKWVAEKMLKIAESRGVPISIYRPGFVGGHSKTGAFNSKDLMNRMIKGAIQLGALPDVNMVVDTVPVDYVGKSIVFLSQQEKCTGKIYHLINTESMIWYDMIESMRSMGIPLELLPYHKWLSKLLNAIHNSQKNELHPLVPFLSRGMTGDRISNFEMYANATVTLKLDCKNTLTDLAESDIVCPSADIRLFRIYFERFVKSGFIDYPGTEATFT